MGNLIITVFIPVLYALWEYLPLEQGLRLDAKIEYSFCLHTLWEYLPLEQGLRRNWELADTTVELWEYLPLKQGLRHSASYGKAVTRPSERIFHYNKDK